MSASFTSPREFKQVIDRVFEMMSEDPDMGPKLRDADVPQRFEFPDVDMVVNIRAAQDGEGPLAGGAGPPAAVAPARLVARLRERGHTLNELREASRAGRLAYGYVEDLFPEPAETVTLEQA